MTAAFARRWILPADQLPGIDHLRRGIDDLIIGNPRVTVLNELVVAINFNAAGGVPAWEDP
jgi:hypothetical protein